MKCTLKKVFNHKLSFQPESAAKCSAVKKITKSGKERWVKPQCDKDGCNDKAKCVSTKRKTSSSGSNSSSQKTSKSDSCKLIMYDQTYFRGKTVTVRGNLDDFKKRGFDNAIASVKIEGKCCWTLYADKNYRGASVNLNNGEYHSATFIINVFKKASSAKFNKNGRC